jgi:serine/threonine protein phosphatase PrpC
MKNDALETEGSTAVVVVVHESDNGTRTLLSANVGDSRAILSRKGKAVPLTTDHKPTEPNEKKRIVSVGGTIEWDASSRVHRVNGLSLSRAMGDRYGQPAVSAECEIKIFPVQEGDDEFVVLASDGLWDVMTNQDVVDFVHEHMNDARASKGNIKNQTMILRRIVAKYLAREAIARGSQDNVSVVVVWL